MGFMNEKKEAEEVTAGAYVRLSKEVAALTENVNSLQHDISMLQGTIADLNASTRADISQQLQQTAETALAPISAKAEQITASISAAAYALDKKKKNDFKDDAVMIATSFFLFCVPCFIAGWWFHDSAAERVLWNQVYPAQQVTPFTSQKDFQKLKDNQEKYLDGIKQQEH